MESLLADFSKLGLIELHDCGQPRPRGGRSKRRPSEAPVDLMESLPADFSQVGVDILLHHCGQPSGSGYVRVSEPTLVHT